MFVAAEWILHIALHKHQFLIRCSSVPCFGSDCKSNTFILASFEAAGWCRNNRAYRLSSFGSTFQIAPSGAPLGTKLQ